MVTLDTFVEKYLRLTDDLHEMRWAIKDIRACFVALTASCYVAILLYALLACLRRRRQPGRVAGVVGSRKPAPRKSKGGAYDVEAGEEWDEMMAPPPPDAMKTLDGYRYKSPVGARRKSQQQALSRRASEAAYGESGGRQQSLVDNRTTLMKSARFSDNARTNLTFGEGFIEKTPSIN